MSGSLKKIDDQYLEFLQTKKHKIDSVGLDIPISDINPMLFNFQKDIVQWAAKKGRAAIFLDTGLGKTFIQLEWARLLGKKTLIIAPLSVARQTIKEGIKINMGINYCRSNEQLRNGINITNYELIDHFDENNIEAIILDESSILKSLNSKTRKKLINKFSRVKYKLCCTATPAPNDFIELGNHAHFLNICTQQEMLAMFFINANKEHTIVFNDTFYTKKGSNKGGQEWRLKHHAEERFFDWLSQWSITMTMPSDLGYQDNGFVLPKLSINPLYVKSNGYCPPGNLFFTGLAGISDRVRIREETIKQKIPYLKDLIGDSPKEQWIVWCGLDKEAKEAKNVLKQIAIEVKGGDTIEYKTESFEKFQDGDIPVLITKPKIGAFGMNFQNSNNMIFLGINDSWETYYEAIRRQWRFGQKNKVNVTVLLAEEEREIFENIQRKEKQVTRLKINMISRLKEYEKLSLAGGHMNEDSYQEKTIEGHKWKAMLGDSSVMMKEIKNDMVALSIYSPPFADLFVYSNSDRDLGNSKNFDEFFQHYNFIIKEVLRVTKPGRLSCVHTSDIPAMANRDGYIGLKDFPGEVIREHIRCGWTFVGRIFIQKNPQAQAIRVKSKSLLFVQMNKDSSHSRPALVDQILIFKKPGENTIPITPIQNNEMNNELWIKWAHGIWLDILETETLQYYQAREKDDEKHVCPLQLGTIERCIKLYSNPGELVLTPFMGIGSEAYMAVKLGRKAIGIELKKSYFDIAINNLKTVEHPTLFDGEFFSSDDKWQARGK
jgi:DNA modification methylase